MGSGSVATVLTVNGEPRKTDIAPGETLLDALRDRFGLTGAKLACGRGECGACTVLIGGRPVMACVTLAIRIDEPIETIEGLAEEARDLRAALADCGGFQCAFCTPGMVVRGVALLRHGLPETDAGLRRELTGNLCRCTGYQGVIEALRRVATDPQRTEIA
jgi:aerobic-type carbon monoxide dehydrogenase small subunit (CoxS/CutS family)